MLLLSTSKLTQWEEGETMAKLNVYLNFEGNTEEAFNFYRTVFGGEFRNVTRFKDMPMAGIKLQEKDQNKIMHIELPIGKDNVLMGTDTLRSLGQKTVMGNNVQLSLFPESKEEADKLFNSLSAGSKIEMPLTNQVWGDYYGACRDKFGVMWMVDFTYPKAETKQQTKAAAPSMR